ncbi:hypothetical protein [Dongia deserti]|uniref:hypothetical protein n=1 Tax=Dongia deserti TaxID=2268030 RepID=UPI0013C4EDAB|nr:hypothetical protein [Dongia deserti]
MNGGDCLSRVFVEWQGQRVFVPWFGALRVVPSAENGSRLARAHERTHIVLALGFFPGVAAAFWIGEPDLLRGLLVGMVIVLGASIIRDYRHVRAWPKLNAGGYWQFNLARLQSLPAAEWLQALAPKLAAVLIFSLIYFPLEGWLAEDAGSTPLAVKWALIILGPGFLGFLLMRDAAIVVVSLMLRLRRA